MAQTVASVVRPEQLATAIVASTVAKNLVEEMTKTEIEKSVPTIFRYWAVVIHGHIAKNYAELSQEIHQGNAHFKFLAESLSGGVTCEKDAEFSQSDHQLIQVKLSDGRWHDLTPYEMEHTSLIESISQWHLDDGDFLLAPNSDTAYSGDVHLRGFLRNGRYLADPIRVKFVAEVAPAVSLVLTDHGIWQASAPMTHEMFYTRYEKQIAYDSYLVNSHYAYAI